MGRSRSGARSGPFKALRKPRVLPPQEQHADGNSVPAPEHFRGLPHAQRLPRRCDRDRRLNEPLSSRRFICFSATPPVTRFLSAASALAVCQKQRNRLRALTGAAKFQSTDRAAAANVWLSSSAPGSRSRPRELSRLHPISSVASNQAAEARMNGLIYLIGLIVVIMAILSFFGLR